MSEVGLASLDLVLRVEELGVRQAVLLLRHSAREYAPRRHDLENPLTEEGREFARRLGVRLPKSFTLRGYASPPDRCMETAELILAGHRDAGGQATRHLAIEAFGVFYVLDQRKFWKSLEAAGRLSCYVERWVAGDFPRDAMLPADVAADTIARVMAEKLLQPVAEQQLDVCVSHDITLHLLRRQLLGDTSTSPVECLDGLILFEEASRLKRLSPDGREVSL